MAADSCGKRSKARFDIPVQLFGFSSLVKQFTKERDFRPDPLNGRHMWNEREGNAGGAQGIENFRRTGVTGDAHQVRRLGQHALGSKGSHVTHIG